MLVFFAITINFEIYEWFNVGSTGFTTNDFILILMILMFLKITIWDGAELKIAKNPAILFYSLFILSTLISGLYPLLSGNKFMIMQYFKSIVHFHFTYLITLILILYKFENETWENFIKIWLILSIGINLFGVYQIIARALDLPFAWFELTNASFYSRNMHESNEITQLSLRFEGFFRATSFFSEPSALAAFNGMTLVFSIIPKLKNFKPFLNSEKVTNLVIILSIVGLLLAFSLTGATIVVIILVMLFLTEKLNVVWRFLKVLPVIIVVVIVSNYIVESYSGISVLELFGKRFGTLSNLLLGKSLYTNGIEGESVIDRGNNFISLFNIWLSSPIIGIGLGTTYLSPYADGMAFSDTSLMAVLGELGLVGIIPYLGLYVTFYSLGLRLTLTNSIYKSFDNSYKRLVTLIIYFLSYIIVTNLMSGNNLSSFTSALLFGFIISITNNYYIDYEKRFYVLRFVEKPLKQRFFKINDNT